MDQKKSSSNFDMSISSNIDMDISITCASVNDITINDISIDGVSNYDISSTVVSETEDIGYEEEDLSPPILTEEDKKRSEKVIIRRSFARIKEIGEFAVDIEYLRSYSLIKDSKRPRILIIHESALSPDIHSQEENMKIFSAMGHDCVAINLPYKKRSINELMNDHYKGFIIAQMINLLHLENVAVIISCSNVRDIFQVLPSDRISSVIAVSAFDSLLTNEEIKLIKTPFLLMHGEKQAYIPFGHRQLKVFLPNKKEVCVPGGYMECYKPNPEIFQNIVLRWFIYAEKAFQ
uniref:FSH1 domain-containing protein n=1 Tax=Strongyloides papillosus TaxID=174720 RepID=A0A0N5BCU0_STREA